MSIEFEPAKTDPGPYERVFFNGHDIGRVYLNSDGTFRAQIEPAIGKYFGVTGFATCTSRRGAILKAMDAADKLIQSSIDGVAAIRATMDQLAEVAA